MSVDGSDAANDQEDPMPLDLTTAIDHPAVLLDNRSAALARRLDSGPSPEIVARDAEALRLHEQVKDVTFAALDNAALARVREAYEAKRENPSTDLGGDLADAVRDLLGLDD